MSQTLAPLTPSRPLSVLQLSDLHVLLPVGEKLLGVDTGHYFARVLELALQEHPQPDLLLLTGDLAQSTTPETYAWIRARIEPLGIAGVCLPGNHDDWEMMQQTLNGEHIGCSKQVLLGNWHIVCLNSKKPDSPGGHLGAGELAFLEGALRGYPQHHTLVAMHHHCRAIGSRWLDAQQIDNGAALLALLARFPQVRAVTCGHIHQAISFNSGAMHLYSAPSACFQFQPGSETFAVSKTAPGYRWFKLHPDGWVESGISRLAGQLDELHVDLAGY